MQHVEAGLVRGEPGALDLHAAERTHVRMSVFLAAPRAAPVLHLHHLFVGMGDEVLDHVLLAQPVAAAHGIVEMVVQAVVGPRHRGGPAFRGHGVAAHRVDLGNQRDLQRRIRFGDRDRRPQTCATRAYNRYVCLEYFHCLSPHR